MNEPAPYITEVLPFIVGPLPTSTTGQVPISRTAYLWSDGIMTWMSSRKFEMATQTSTIESTTEAWKPPDMTCTFLGNEFELYFSHSCTGNLRLVDKLDAVRWQVVKRDPLTVTPSIYCSSCLIHGMWLKGKWVPHSD